MDDKISLEQTNTCSDKKKKCRMFFLFSLCGWIIAATLGLVIYSYPQYICKTKPAPINIGLTSHTSANSQPAKLQPVIPSNILSHDKNEEIEINPIKEITVIKDPPQILQKSDLNFHLLVAVINLQEAANQNKPFDKELHKLLIIGKNYPDILPEIKKLEAYSGLGIPSLKQLSDEFDSTSSRINNYNLTIEKNNGFKDKLIAHFAKVIDIRKTDPNATGDDSIAILSRTSSLVHSGNIVESIAQINKLQSQHKPIAQNWIEKAQRYNDYNKTLNTIFEYTKLLVYNL